MEVGRPASESMSLKPGRRIFIIIKSMTCTLYEERKSGTNFHDASHPKNPQHPRVRDIQSLTFTARKKDKQNNG
ncbi:MAG TPA: hypothetical protein VI895_08090 [Bdellovibrionota bacterium]|nr:hypothetical protein [Bdellovibrionota bacterium]